MAVYVDDFYKTGLSRHKGMKMSHMIADSRAELLSMVKNLHISAKHLQDKGTPKEHFDVCMNNRLNAIKLGAIPIGFRELTRKIQLRKQIKELDKAHNQWVQNNL